jgi:hypothetical protein
LPSFKNGDEIAVLLTKKLKTTYLRGDLLLQNVEVAMTIHHRNDKSKLKRPNLLWKSAPLYLGIVCFLSISACKGDAKKTEDTASTKAPAQASAKPKKPKKVDLDAICKKTCDTTASLKCSGDKTPENCTSTCSKAMKDIKSECKKPTEKYMLCTQNISASDWECNADGYSSPKASVCAAEKESYLKCLGVVDYPAICKYGCEQAAPLKCPQEKNVDECAKQCMVDFKRMPTECLKEIDAYLMCGKTTKTADWRCTPRGTSDLKPTVCKDETAKVVACFKIHPPKKPGAK